MKVSADQKLTRPLALDMPLPEAGIELLQERRLLGAQLDRLLGVLALERQPALVPRAEPLVVEDLLDGDRRQPPAFQRQQRLEPVAAIGRMHQRQRLDPRHHLGWRGHRVALGDRRQILQPVQTLELEAPLPIVEAGPVDPATSASLGDVAQPLGQLQHRQPAMRQLRVRVLGRDPTCRLCHRSPPFPAAWTLSTRKTSRLRRLPVWEELELRE